MARKIFMRARVREALCTRADAGRWATLAPRHWGGCGAYIAILAICLTAMASVAEACSVQTNAAQVTQGQKDIEGERRAITKLGRKATRIFVGSVSAWAASRATFVDIVNLKGLVQDGVVVDWSSLLQDDSTEVRVSCVGPGAIEGNVPEELQNGGIEVDYGSMKVSYLVYMDGQRYLRAVILDGWAHREIDWLRKAGIVTAK
jgi:hypothetical protein